MTLRRLIPYLLVAVLFAFAYWLTMIIPNSELLLGYGAGTKEVVDNDKIPLHLYIFNYGLALAIATINFLEIITTVHDMTWLRLIKSMITVVLVYVITYFIFLSLNTRIFNMHFYYRGSPARLWCVVTVVLSILCIAILEIFKRIYLIWFDKSAVSRSIPEWLKMESQNKL